MIEDQINRQFFNKPTRHTTIFRYPSKYSYEEFIEKIQSFGLQNSLQNQELYIEEWMETFLAFNEIENQEEDEEVSERDYAILHVCELD